MKSQERRFIGTNGRVNVELYVTVYDQGNASKDVPVTIDEIVNSIDEIYREAVESYER